MARIPGDLTEADSRIPGALPGVGISSALYDAALADLATAEGERDTAEAKLVVASAWVDLTAAITTACAGAASSDPDSLKAGLTVTTTTGTFDGETIPCNQFNWTTHTTTNDGHGETLNHDLGTIATHIPSYDPALHILQIEADLVATGTLNTATPMLAVAVAPSGTLAATSTPACGPSIVSATSVLAIRSMNTTAYSQITAGDPTARVGRLHMRSIPTSGASNRIVYGFSQLATTTPDDFVKSTATHAASTDKLYLCLGQSSTNSGAVSGIKVRFRIRILAVANIDLTDLDLGCQA